MERWRDWVVGVRDGYTDGDEGVSVFEHESLNGVLEIRGVSLSVGVLRSWCEKVKGVHVGLMFNVMKSGGCF